MADSPSVSDVSVGATKTPTSSSFADDGSGFALDARVRWIRCGIGCWVSATCIGALTYLCFLLIVLGSAPFWNALHQPGSWPHLVHRFSGAAYSYAPLATVPLRAAAVILIVVPILGTSFYRRWLGGIVTTAALSAAAGLVYTNLSALVQLPVVGQIHENRVVSIGASLTYGICILLAWLSLTLGLQHDRRAIRVLMWAGFAALALQLASTIALSCLAVFGTQPTYLDNGLMILNEWPPWELAALECISFCRNTLWFPTEILLCLGLWACLRTLNRLAGLLPLRAPHAWYEHVNPTTVV